MVTKSNVAALYSYKFRANANPPPFFSYMPHLRKPTASNNSANVATMIPVDMSSSLDGLVGSTYFFVPVYIIWY